MYKTSIFTECYNFYRLWFLELGVWCSTVIILMLEMDFR